MFKNNPFNFFNFYPSVSFVSLLLVFIGNIQRIDAGSCLFKQDRIGLCIKFEDCPSAIASARRGRNPEFCNLEEGIVCCTDSPVQTESIGHGQLRPFPDAHSGNSQKWQNDYPGHLNPSGLDTERESNTQRKKHSVWKPGGNSNGNTHGKKKNDFGNEDPYKFEKPGAYYSEGGNKPSRPGGSNILDPSDENDEGYFGPPEKKKIWREEKTTEHEYYYEHATKKPNRGPNRKGPNKHVHEGNNSPKRVDEDSTRRNEWSNQGGRRTTEGYDWYDNQNGHGNDYSNHRTTTKQNKWTQETYTTTRRNDYSGHRPNNNYGGNEDAYANVKPTRKPYRTTTEENYYNRPNSKPQGNNPPGFQQGSQNKPQPSRPQGNNPTGFQQGFQNKPQPSRPQGNNPTGFQQGFQNKPQPSRPQGNNPTGFQQGFQNKPQPSRPQGNNRPNSRPDPQKRRRISEQKCEEYSKQITENITGLPLTTNPDPVTIPIRKCITPQQLIVGGENTTLGEFPHMAAIGFRDRNKNQISWNCGGTLISERFVMTAAHCTSTSSGRPVKVRLGEYNLMKNDDGAHPVDYAVVDIITHPDYKPPSKYNDIALLKLSRKVTFFKHIRPACLYAEDTVSVSMAIATGWGRMYYDGSTSEILQKVILNIVDNNTCNRLYKVNVRTEVLSRGIVESQVCAGELTGGKDTCQGDSGGPLSITSTKCIHHVIGITSFGKSCALPNSTGVYTRVSAYLSWIESIAWPTESNYN